MSGDVPPSSEILELLDLARAVDRGELTPEELVERFLARRAGGTEPVRR